MAEQLNNNFLVVDTRLHSSNKIPFPVYQGGQSVNTQRFSSNSSSANNINFNIQVPSETVIMSRRAMIDAKLNFTVTCPVGAFDTAARFRTYVEKAVSGGVTPGGANNVDPADGGAVLSLSAFPLHTMMNSTVAQINNVSVTQNSSEILDTIVRCLTLDDLSHNSEAASMPDYYQNYSVPAPGAGAKNVKAQRVLGQYNDSVFKPNMFGRNSVLSYTVLTDPAPSPTSLVLQVDVREPLLMSPFVFDANEHEGLSQLQNIILNLNLNPNTKRVYRTSGIPFVSANTNAIDNITLTNVVQSFVTLTFLTPKPSEIPQSARVALPYYEIRSNTKGITQTVVNNTTLDITSDSYQLPVIPHTVLIYAKPKTSGGVDLVSSFGGTTYGDSYAKVQSLSINFNNNSGILSSLQPKDLYELSRRNSNLTFQEWSDDNLVGSFVALRFGQDIQIADQTLAPGSLGSFNFQYNIKIQNTTGVDQVYDLYTVFLYQGCFVSERGSSASYIGLLDRQQVLEASKLKPIKRGELESLMGSGRSGGFLGMLASLIPAAISGLSSLFTREGSGMSGGMNMSGGASKLQSVLDKYSM